MYTRNRRVSGLMAGLLLGMAGMASGCMDRELKPLNPCLVSGVAQTVKASGIDKIDMLFAVDNSLSMLEEQTKLRQQIPRLVKTLVSGEVYDESGTVLERSFPPAKDLHLGVITTDLGVPGLGQYLPPQFKCDDEGDNGVMVTQTGTDDPNVLSECSNMSLTDRRFIEYKATGGLDEAEVIADRFGCLAAVGSEGCGYEMQLEAVLKSLWPYYEYDIDPKTDKPYDPPRLDFLAATDQYPTNIYGNGGDAPYDFGNGVVVAKNGGFLRNNAAEGLSLVAIVLVTDEEDCSSAVYNHLVPDNIDADNVPEKARTTPPNLRCNAFAEDPGYLYPTDRYVKYLQALREGFEQLVIFAAITGVPTQTQEWLENDYDLRDDAEREAFYDFLLNRPEMQPTLDVNGTNLNSSCETPDNGVAYPARRIVEVARGFGANGVVQSICQESFLPAINAIIDVIATKLSDVCLPRSLVRQSNGEVGCRVVWELPKDPATASVDAPRSCADKPFLEEPTNGVLYTDKGAIRCDVKQIAITDTSGGKPTGVEGWYYDDFTEEAEKCTGSNKQRIAFTDNAVPANGVVIQLECLNETQNVQASTEVNYQAYTNAGQTPPAIGTPCESDDAQCQLILNGGNMSTDMFCHAEQNVCVKQCNSDVDCPPAWVCDTRAEPATAAGGGTARPFCVNPTCGTSE